MNIMLNNHCNLNCHYCFAGVDENNNRINITDENMDKFINFLKNSNYRKLRILGGEPTLHPNFEKYVKIANEDPFFKDVIIITNGLALNKELSESIVSEKNAFLINLNSIKDIGEEKYIKTYENIDNLIKIYSKKNLKPKVFLGINFYNKDFDYSYIIETAKKLKIRGVRYSIIVPPEVGRKVSIDYYKEFIPLVMNFLQDCSDNNILASTDCNYIPKCLFTKEQLVDLMFSGFDICTKNICKCVYDTTPNLEVTRCMPFTSKFKVDLEKFNNIAEIGNYFKEIIDSKRYEVPTFEECRECEWFKSKKCQGACLTYKFK